MDRTALPRRRFALRLLAVQLDDQRFPDGNVDLFTDRAVTDGGFPAIAAHVDPCRSGPVNDVLVPLERGAVLALWSHRNHIALTEAVARNVDAAAIHIDVAMIRELASLRAGLCPTNAVHQVVEAQFKELQHVLAGHALLAGGFLVQVAELALRQTVRETSLLLFLQLDQVFADVAAATGTTVLAGRVGTLVKSDSFALGAPDVGAETTRNACLGSCLLYTSPSPRDS